jgi:hypothetical protein
MNYATVYVAFPFGVNDSMSMFILFLLCVVLVLGTSPIHI